MKKGIVFESNKVVIVGSKNNKDSNKDCILVFL